MSENHKVERCFLCRKKLVSGIKSQLINLEKCPASQRSLKDVLYYIARCAEIELYISHYQRLCFSCGQKIKDFDTNKVRVLQQQKNLLQQIEKAAVDIDSDFEKEFNCWDESEDFLHNNNDMPSDNEIADTVQELITSQENEYEQSHASQHGNIAAEPILHMVCHFCSKSFRGKFLLHEHLAKAHHRFKCDLCDFIHRNEDYVKLHKNIHEGRKMNQCLYCHKEFTTKMSVIRHMEVHLDAKKYQCDKCGLCFSQTTVLYNHRLQHEAEEEPLRCTTCLQLFKTKRTYRRHMITHRADRPRYRCEQCGKTFTEKYTLKVHKSTHVEMSMQAKQRITKRGQSNNRYRLECIVCKEFFINNDQLNKHMEEVHDVILNSVVL